MNVPALTETILESALFGHVRGAFTGALTDRVGRFEAANRGTLFLDEIGDMKMHLQVKLLRTLQERTVERVGDNKTVPVDVRIVSATNLELSRLVDAGRFRRDLYYRLRVFPISVPPLRERREDIPLLVASAMEEIAGSARPRISSEAKRAPREWEWPGKVRELRNAVEYALACRADPITIAHLPPELSDEEVRRGAAECDRTALGSNGERELAVIERALELAKGSRTRAASMLGISRHTLWRKMRRYGLDIRSGRYPILKTDPAAPPVPEPSDQERDDSLAS